MYEVTDTVFRQIIADCASPDLFFTEFVNVDGLNSAGRDKLMKHLIHTDKDKPLIAQIWGKNPENYYEIAKQLPDMGFDGVDINMGCPDKAIVRQGCCGAFINNRDEAIKIIKAVKEGVGGRIPVGVKTRLGFGEIDFSWHELLLNQKLDMLSIHGRTVRQMSRADANWEAIGHISKLRDKISPNTLLIGNGDVESTQEGRALAQKYKVDGVMIGRGVFHDPFVFSDASPWNTYTKQQRIDLYKKHVNLFNKTWKNNERPIVTLNKFCKIYINGFDGAKEIRENLMSCSDANDLLDKLENL